MKLILRSLIVLVILFFGSAAFLLTETGLRLTVDAASKLIPGKIKYKHISGVIIGPITIDNLEYQNNGNLIEIKKLNLNWQLLSLLKKELTITDLSMNGLTIVYSPQKKLKQKPITAKTIKATLSQLQSLKLPELPFQLNVKAARINHISFLNKKNKFTYQINKINFFHKTTDQTLKTQLLITMPYNYPIKLVKFDFTHAKKDHLQLLLTGINTHLSIIGNGEHDKLNIHTEKSAFLNGSLNTVLSINYQKTPHWTGSLIIKQINSALLNPKWPKQLSSNINSTGNLERSKTSIKIAIPNGTINAEINKHKALAIKWQLEVLNLSQLNTEYAGTIHSQGTFNTNAFKNLNTHGYINATALSTPYFYAKQAQLTWKLNTNHDHHIHIVLNANQIDALEQHFNSLTLKTSGSISQQTLAATIKQAKKTYSLLLTGSYNNHQWIGLIHKLQMKTPHKIYWRLTKPTKIVASSEHITFSQLCLLGDASENLCAAGNWSTHSPWKIKLNGTLPFSTLSYFIPHKYAQASQGQLSINLDIQQKDTQYPTLTGSIHVTKGHINLPEQNITLRNFNVGLIGDNDRLKYKITATTNGSPITLSGITDLSKSPLQTTLKLKTNNALLINTEEYIAYLTVNLTAHMKGKKIVISGDITVPKSNIQPHDFHTVTTLPTSDIIFLGEKHKKSSPWQIDSNLTVNLGDNVNVQTSGIKAQLDGNLKLVSQTNKETFATGQIRVVKGSYSAFGKTLKITPNSFINYSNSLLNNPFLNIKATKKIASIRGTEESFIIGISISGTIKNPSVTFFSSPNTLSQADILSYLILGYANNSNAPGDHDILLHALSALDITTQGLAGKQNIAEQIQQGLGLSELGVESENTVDALGTTLNRQSSFVIGKRLSNDIIVRYSIGILDPINVFQIRYLLNHNWALQADSSAKGYGFDTLYTIERD